MNEYFVACKFIHLKVIPIQGLSGKFVDNMNFRYRNNDEIY